MSEAPRAGLNFAPAEVDVERRVDGTMILTSPQALEPHERQLGEWLRRAAAAAPERTFLAERGPDGAWRRLDYGAARAGADAVSQALLDRGLGPERPVMALSPNGIDLALLLLGAMQVGIPAVPVSPAYSLMSRDFTRLKHIHGVVEPALVYAADGELFGAALAALELGGAELVVSARPPTGLAATEFQELLEVAPTATVDQAFARVGEVVLLAIISVLEDVGVSKNEVRTAEDIHDHGGVGHDEKPRWALAIQIEMLVVAVQWRGENAAWLPLHDLLVRIRLPERCRSSSRDDQDASLEKMVEDLSLTAGRDFEHIGIVFVLLRQADEGSHLASAGPRLQFKGRKILDV